MKTVSEVIMAPKFLRCEIESLQSLLSEMEIRLPGYPVLDKIRATIDKREKEAEDIEQWLQGIEDPFIKDAVQAYRKTGSWNRVNSEVYNYPSYHTCRSAVKRHFEKMGFAQRFR